MNPQGQVVNTVGSGDSTVAGMVAGLASGLSIQDAFKQAVASGTATAFDEDLATRDRKLNLKLQFLYLMGSEINENHRTINKRHNRNGFICLR